MNREIKFRFWSFFEKQFIYWSFNDTSSPPNQLGYYGGLSEPQQYTGLRDKNGREVFEGDIMTGISEGKQHQSHVFFGGGSFHINGDYPLYDHTTEYAPDILNDFVVVGNIFENPEFPI